MSFSSLLWYIVLALDCGFSCRLACCSPSSPPARTLSLPSWVVSTMTTSKQLKKKLNIIKKRLYAFELMSTSIFERNKVHNILGPTKIHPKVVPITSCIDIHQRKFDHVGQRRRFDL